MPLRYLIVLYMLMLFVVAIVAYYVHFVGQVNEPVAVEAGLSESVPHGNASDIRALSDVTPRSLKPPALNPAQSFAEFCREIS